MSIGPPGSPFLYATHLSSLPYNKPDISLPFIIPIISLPLRIRFWLCGPFLGISPRFSGSLYCSLFKSPQFLSPLRIGNRLSIQQLRALRVGYLLYSFPIPPQSQTILLTLSVRLLSLSILVGEHAKQNFWHTQTTQCPCQRGQGILAAISHWGKLHIVISLII